jgi:hypothetical protein
MAFAVAIVLTPWQVADLVGWDVTAALFVGSVLVSTRGKDPAQTKAMAIMEDSSRVAADGILIGASVASLIGWPLPFSRPEAIRVPLTPSSSPSLFSVW